MQKLGRPGALFFLILLFLFQLPSAGQNKKYFVITGKIVPEVETSASGTIEMLKGNVPSKIEIPKNGRFRLELEYFNEYTLTFILPGHFSKTIVVSTDIPQEVWKRDNDFPPYQMFVQLFREIEGIDKSFTLKPSGRVFYGKQTDNFEKESFFNDIQIAEQIETAKIQSGQVKKEAQTITKQEALDLAAKQKNYDQAIMDADANFKRGEYQLALIKYQEAKKLFPEKAYANDRIAELQDLVKALEITEKQKAELDLKYKNAIARANGFFDLKTYKEARPNYEEALQYKPGDVFASGRIQEIDRLLEQIEKQKQLEDLIARTDKDFEQAIQQGDQQKAQEKYDKAINFYRDALKIKPNNELALGKISEVENILEKERLARLLDDNYKSVILRADNAFGSENFADARKSYTEALAIKPNEVYPTGQISKIDGILAEKARLQLIETEFLAMVGKGDAAFDQKEYESAKTIYLSALDIKPNSAEVKNKIKNIDSILQKIADDKKKEEDRLLALAAAKEKAYTDAIAQADKSFDKKDYVASQSDYRKALTIKSDETYPANRIKEIDQILEKERLARLLDDNYKSVILRADNAFGSENFADARKSYTEALAIKPNEVYPTGQISKIDGILAEKVRLQQIETEFLAMVGKGDAAFDQKEYESAKTIYLSALDIKPNSAEVTNKIKNIDSILQKIADDKKKEEDRLLALAAAKEKAYTDAITQADKSFDKKDYVASQSDYRKALTIKSDETYPANRIKEIDQILEKERLARLLDDNYKSVILRADNAFGSENFADARKSYTEALAIKPNEVYPTGQISKIDGILAEKARLQQIETEFLAMVGKGDAAFDQKEYESAKTIYLSALDIKPNSAEVTNKIKNIDSILQKIADDKKKEEDRLLALAAAKEKAYTDAIAQADKSFDKKDYVASQSDYRKALTIKSDETYPANRIKEIDQILEKERLARLLDDNYKSVILKADNAFGSENFADARKSYTEALAIKPNEVYPTGQISKIDGILAEKARLQLIETEFLAMVGKGDAAFDQKEYESAKTNYTSALVIKPNSAEVKIKIKNIDSILQKLAEDKKIEDDRLLALAAKEKAYTDAIAQADKSFDKKDFVASQSDYRKALTIKAEESYPANRIKEIDQILEKELQAKLLEDNYKTVIARADKSFGSESYVDARKIYTEALAIKPNEVYPTGQISKIDGILAEKARLQQIETEFLAMVGKGDAAFDQKEYESAKTSYSSALDIKPNSAEVTNKIKNIDSILQKIADDKKKEEDRLLALDAAKEKAYTETMAKGNKQIDQKTYSDARVTFQEAKKLKPAELLPDEMIAKIDSLIAGNERELAAAKLKEEAYQKSLKDAMERSFNEAMANADKAFSENDFNTAKTGYETALTIKVADPVAKSKLGITEAKLAQLAKMTLAYNTAINMANQFVSDKRYKEAKEKYQEALQYLPDSDYPKRQIEKLNELLAQADSERQKDELYASTLKDGEKLFTNKEYSGARSSFVKASELKPAETLPLFRIKEIDKILADLSLADLKIQQYNQAIAAGDLAFKADQLDEATTQYELALTIKANDPYSKKQLAEITKKRDALLAEKAALKKLNDQYESLMADANINFKSKEYQKAKGKYQDALLLKPAETLPKEQIAKIDELLKELMNAEEINRLYVESVKIAQEAFRQNKLKEALDAYTKAHDLKPTEPMPPMRIAELTAMIAQLDETAKLAAMEDAQRLAKEKADKEQYDKAIVVADKAFAEKQYKISRTRYTDALSILPNEKYPKDQISKIDELIAQQEEMKMLAQSQAMKDSIMKVRDEAFNRAMASAKELEQSKQYQNAILKYKEAISINPGERSNVQKLIVAIEDLIRLIESQDKQYQQIIAKADQLFTTTKLEEALTEYRNASNIKTTEEYPKQKIIEIQNIIAKRLKETDQKILDEKLAGIQNSAGTAAYNEAIAKAEKAFLDDQLTTAIMHFKVALTLKPDESLPAQRIKEIEALIEQRNKERLAQTQRDIDEKYRQSISVADNAFREKTYPIARLRYQEAQLIKPDESYPKNQIALIDKLLNEEKPVETYIAQELPVTKPAKLPVAPVFNPEETTQATEARAISFKPVADYEEAIRKADDSFGVKDYTVARFFYTKASDLKPKEEYPKNQIELIRKLVDSELSMLDRSGYEEAIAQADGAFSKENYTIAKFYYYKALEIKSWEKYPKDRIQEILALTHSLLSEKEEKEYRDLIAKGDEAYFEKEISVARFYFNKAITMKTDENYPRIKLKDIQKLIDQDTQDQKNLEYNNLIEQADQALQSENYSIARFNYNKALNMKPDEKYPKDQLKRIREALDKQNK